MCASSVILNFYSSRDCDWSCSLHCMQEEENERRKEHWHWIGFGFGNARENTVRESAHFSFAWFALVFGGNFQFPSMRYCSLLVE